MLDSSLSIQNNNNLHALPHVDERKSIFCAASLIVSDTSILNAPLLNNPFLPWSDQCIQSAILTQMNLYPHISYSSGLKWLTDYIEQSDSLADHTSGWSSFLEEGQILQLDWNSKHVRLTAWNYPYAVYPGIDYQSHLDWTSRSQNSRPKKKIKKAISVLEKVQTAS